MVPLAGVLGVSRGRALPGPHRRAGQRPSVAGERVRIVCPRCFTGIDLRVSRRDEPGSRRRLRRRVGLSEFHVNPHLAVGDVSTWQGPFPHCREKIGPLPESPDRQMA
jgi:hypothetical protein